MAAFTCCRSRLGGDSRIQPSARGHDGRPAFALEGHRSADATFGSPRTVFRPPSATRSRTVVRMPSIKSSRTKGSNSTAPSFGYSLGGRVALSWWTDQPHRFDRIVVMAPDGLVKNPGYRFSVDTAIGRTWLNQSGRQRSSLVQLLNALRSVRVLPSHFHQFSLFHLETADMWSMVIDCWISLRKFWPSRRRIRRTAKAHPGVLEAHFGERDKVIKPRNSKALKGCGPVHFHPCGHGLLRPDIIQRIASPSSKS